MPEPTTTAAITKAIVSAAKKKLAEKFAEKIVDSVFGKDEEYDKIIDRLDDIEIKLDELISISSANYTLLLEIRQLIDHLPEVIATFGSHRQLEALGTALRALGRRPTNVAYDTIVEGLKSFNTICDFEFEYGLIARVPAYSELLYVISKGRLGGAVAGGLERLEVRLQDRMDELEAELVSRFASCNQVFEQPHIRSGQIHDKHPWVSWLAAAHRTRTVTDYICRNYGTVGGINGEICDPIESQVPDDKWNRAVNLAVKTLQEQRKSIGSISDEVNTLGTLLAMIGQYKALISEQTPQESMPEGSSFVVEHLDDADL